MTNKKKHDHTVSTISYIKFGNYKWYFDIKKLFHQNKEIYLTYKESDLFSIFANHPNEYLNRN